MINPKVQEIIDKVASKFEQYTTPNSITPMVVTSAIAEAIQSTYVPKDLFMTNSNVKDIDFSNYFNIERLFAQGNPFVNFDLSLLPLLKELYLQSAFTYQNTVNKNTFEGIIDFSLNQNLEKLIILDFFKNPTNINLTTNSLLKEVELYGENLTSIDISGLTNIEKLSIGAPISTIDFFASKNNLKEVYFEQVLIPSFDFEDCLNIEKIVLYPNNNYDLSISNCPKIKDFRIEGVNLTEAEAESIVNMLVSNGLENGIFEVYTAVGNITPSGTLLTSINSLEALGWQVSLDNY